jgi:hypothetical protein
LFSVSLPELIVPLHELDPAYVPVMADDEA